MRPRGLVLAWATAILGSLVLDKALPAAPPAESPRTVRYDLDARLDPKTHVVHAKGTMAWRSDAEVPVSSLRLHAYLNAFRDPTSVFLTEAKGGRRDEWNKSGAGSVEILSLALPGGHDLSKGMRFVDADGQSPDDKTVLEVPLPQPVLPGKEVVLEIEFEAHLPKAVARTGYGGDFHMVAQWFPKFGVWQDVGEGGSTTAGWNCHAFHASTEFFADYGVYDVRITVPPEYEGQVGATGKADAAGPKRNADGTLTYAFHAEDVHDFAWVAGTNARVFVERFPGGSGTDGEGIETQRVARILGRRIAELSLPPVDVTFILRPEHAGQLERHRRAVFEALTYMGLWFGPYPYPTLTVVDPDARAGAAGGMEYPTLITGGTGYVIADRGIDPEFVLVHEFGHQHFYGMVGTNEFEDAWMDEGFNTYGTAKTLEKAYGPRALASIKWYLGRPSYGEPPIEFPGVLAGIRRLIPGLDKDFLPFGDVGLVASVSRSFGGEPPDSISPWPPGAEVTPLSWLRDLPPLTHLDVPSHTVGEHERSRYADYADTDDLAGRPGWRYLDGKAYGTQSYRRTANLLRTLEGYLGEETMVRLMRTYCEKFRFQHPTPDDFVRTASFVSGQDLGWFFDGLAKDSQSIDFGIHAVENGEKKPDGTRDMTVVVRRFGGARFPTTVHVRFEDGTERRVRWGLDDRVAPLDAGPAVVVDGEPAARGQYRWVKLKFHGTSPVEIAETDPLRLVSLEGDRTNDGWRVSADPRAAIRYAIRACGWVEQLTSFYGGL